MVGDRSPVREASQCSGYRVEEGHEVVPPKRQVAGRTASGREAGPEEPNLLERRPDRVQAAHLAHRRPYRLGIRAPRIETEPRQRVVGQDGAQTVRDDLNRGAALGIRLDQLVVESLNDGAIRLDDWRRDRGLARLAMKGLAGRVRVAEDVSGVLVQEHVERRQGLTMPQYFARGSPEVAFAGRPLPLAFGTREDLREDACAVVREQRQEVENRQCDAPPRQLQKRVTARLIVAPTRIEPGKPRETLKLFDLEGAARHIALEQIGPIHLVETHGLSADARDATIAEVMWHRVRSDAPEPARELGQGLARLLGIDAVNDQQRGVSHQTVTGVT